MGKQSLRGRMSVAWSEHALRGTAAPHLRHVTKQERGERVSARCFRPDGISATSESDLVVFYLSVFPKHTSEYIPPSGLFCRSLLSSSRVSHVSFLKQHFIECLLLLNLPFLEELTLKNLKPAPSAHLHLRSLDFAATESKMAIVTSNGS